MNAEKIDAQIGQKVEYKIGQTGRGRPTKAMVLTKTPRTLTVMRTTNNEIVKIKPSDVIRIASKIKKN